MIKGRSLIYTIRAKNPEPVFFRLAPIRSTLKTVLLLVDDLGAIRHATETQSIDPQDLFRRSGNWESSDELSGKVADLQVRVFE